LEISTPQSPIANNKLYVSKVQYNDFKKNKVNLEEITNSHFSS
jgi:hypothetical protein